MACTSSSDPQAASEAHILEVPSFEVVVPRGPFQVVPYLEVPFLEVPFLEVPFLEVPYPEVPFLEDACPDVP